MPPAVFGCQVGESPDISQSYRGSGGRKYKAQFPGECTSLVVMVFFHKIFLSASVCLNNTAIDDTTIFQERQMIYRKNGATYCFFEA